MLEAGMDGIKNKIDPGDPVDLNIYKLSEDELKKLGIDVLPSSLWEAYHALEEDEVVSSALGEYIYEKFYSFKKKEWDDYRSQVFKYEIDRYLNI